MFLPKNSTNKNENMNQCLCYIQLNVNYTKVFFPFQVGSGLNGTLKDSYVAYDLSLIDRCLYELSPSCKFTITFWAKMPPEPRAHLLSTYKRNVDENTGIQLGLRGNGNRGITLAITITTASAQLGISDRGVVHPDIWYHIAFAWHNTTHFALYIDFVKFVRLLILWMSLRKVMYLNLFLRPTWQVDSRIHPMENTLGLGYWMNLLCSLSSYQLLKLFNCKAQTNTCRNFYVK